MKSKKELNQKFMEEYGFTYEEFNTSQDYDAFKKKYCLSDEEFMKIIEMGFEVLNHKLSENFGFAIDVNGLKIELEQFNNAEPIFVNDKKIMEKENDYTKQNQNKGNIGLNEFQRIMITKYSKALVIPIKEHSDYDTYHHIDCIVCHSNGDCDTYDVKNNLTQHRGGIKCFVVELLNNSGREGSAFGKQKYFAVMDKEMPNATQTKMFWIYSRVDMLEFLESKVGDINEFLKCNIGDDKDADEPTPYKKYTRKHEGKRDVTVLVPISDCKFVTKIEL